MPAHTFSVEKLKTRLDKFLAEQLPEISRSQIQRDIEAGLVTVNDKKIAEAKHIVRVGDRVAYLKSEIFNSARGGPASGGLKFEIKPANIPLKVLYNDHGLLIIDKPAGLTVHPGAGFKGESLAAALLYHFKDIRLVGEEHRPGIVHRLDKDTSGVILVARSQEMYEYLKDAFAERKIKKEYIALMYGKLEKPYGFIDTPIGRSKTDFRKYTVKNPVEAKAALTEYKVLEYLQNPETLDFYTLVLVKLHTGRTHQIRVHFSSLGHPLMGDELYGNKHAVLPGLGRQFLHAKRIEVRLPDKTWIEAESELPSDLTQVLRNLKSTLLNNL